RWSPGRWWFHVRSTCGEPDAHGAGPAICPGEVRDRHGRCGAGIGERCPLLRVGPRGVAPGLDGPFESDCDQAVDEPWPFDVAEPGSRVSAQVSEVDVRVVGRLGAVDERP